MITTTCFYLAYTLSTICYSHVPVPDYLPPLPPVQGYTAPGPASVYQGSNLSVIPTWQDIIRQNAGDDDDQD